MDSGQENIVLYDWLSFTSKKHSPEELIAALGLTACPWQETKGAHGYRDRKYFSCISVHYNGREDMGCWVELSGQGCRTFETLSTVGWDRLFHWIQQEQLKITRLDVAFDDHTGILDIREIVTDTQEGNFVSKSNYWETVLSSKGSTVQIGSPQSKVVVRIYDKARERNCEAGTHWVRVEVQLRDERAVSFTKIPLSIGEAYSGVLLNYLRYVIPNDTDDNRWRWDMKPYWLAMLEVVTPISVYTTPGMEYNIDRCRDYVVNQAGNAIDCMIRIYGIHEVQRMIRHRQTAPNPKYEMLVQEYRYERLAAVAGRYIGGNANGIEEQYPQYTLFRRTDGDHQPAGRR